MILPPRGHLANSGVIFLIGTTRVGMLLAYGGERSKVLLNNPQYMGQPHSKGSSGSADIEELFSRRKEASVGSQATCSLCKMFYCF